MDANPTYGEWLRKQREAKGISREDLGLELHVGGGYIAKLEQGVKSPSPKLHVRIDAFFSSKQEMPNWMMIKLDEIADQIGSTPQDIINTLVYQFIKDA